MQTRLLGMHSKFKTITVHEELMSKESAVDPIVSAFNYYLKEKVLTPIQAENLAMLMLEIAQLHQLKDMKKTPNVAALLDIKQKKTRVLENKLKIFSTEFDHENISELEDQLGVKLS